MLTDDTHLQTTVLDATDVRGVGPGGSIASRWAFSSGPGTALRRTAAPNAEWLIRTDADGARMLAFQALQALPRGTWPYASGVTEQLHLNLTAPDKEALENQRARVRELGAEQLLERTDEPEEPLHVFADPTGHPFCVFVTWAHPSRTPGCARRSGPPTTTEAGCGDPKPTMAGSKPAAGRRRRHRNRWWDGT